MSLPSASENTTPGGRTSVTSAGGGDAKRGSTDAGAPAGGTDAAAKQEEPPPEGQEPADAPDGQLLKAMRQGKVDVATELIGSGVRSIGCDAQGWTLLHYCCIRDAFCEGEGMELLRGLLKQDPEAVQKDTSMGDHPLHLASLHGLKVVAEVLLAAGANPKAETPFGDTPCSLARLYNHQELAAVLAAAEQKDPAPVPAPPPKRTSVTGGPRPPSAERPADSAPKRPSAAATPVASPVPLSPTPPSGPKEERAKGRKGFMKGAAAGLALDGGAIASAAAVQSSEEPTTVMLDDVDVSQVTEWLYLGGLKDALKADLLREHGVTHIVQLAPEYACQQHEGFDYLKVQIEDHPDAPIKDHFQSIFEYLDDCRTKGESCFVHCRKGKSRSPTVVIAYFMRSLGIPFAIAKDIVKRRRSVVELNLGFTAQLEHFETELGIDPSKPRTDYKDAVLSWGLRTPMVEGGKSLDEEDDAHCPEI